MGKVVGSHGVKGWLKIHPFTEKIETLSEYPNWLISSDEKNWDDFKVEKTIVKNNVFLVKLDTINDRNESDVLKKYICLLYTSPSPRDRSLSRMPSSA